MGQHLPAARGSFLRDRPTVSSRSAQQTAVYVPDAVGCSSVPPARLAAGQIYEEKVPTVLTGMRVQRALYEEASPVPRMQRILGETRRLSPGRPSALEVEGDFS